MMEYYYDINQKDQFDTLFKDTTVHKNPTKEKNKYMILKFNFSLINPDDNMVYDSFLNYIQKTTKTFLTKYNKYLGIDLEKAETALNSQKSASDVMVTLLDYLAEKNQKLYVIIDEYDNFANTILSDSGEDAYRALTHGEGFLRSFFNVIKGGTTGSNTPIARIFMTGVSPITLDDVTSGFNIASNISLDDDLNELPGFTKTEVETMIDYYRQTGKIRHTTPDLMEIMGKWYNRYRFSLDSERDVFNTVLVLYFLREYLKKSNIPNELIDSNARIDYKKLRKLIVIDKESSKVNNSNISRLLQIMETGSIHSDIKTNFSIHELTDPTNFVSLLYYFGLLSFNGIDDEDTPILSIPNETVKHLYYDYINDSYKDTGILSIDEFEYNRLIKSLAYKGDWKPLIDYISKEMNESLGLRDLMTAEKAHQVFWNVYLGMNKLYNVYSERELNQGFADLVLEPLLDRNPGIKYSYIIELKYIKPSDYEKDDGAEKVNALCSEAETQLNRYYMDEKFQKTMGKTTLKKLILIFSGNRLVNHQEV